jgi:hypothetical protein
MSRLREKVGIGTSGVNDMSDPSDVVGHKTIHVPGGTFRHEPLLRAEADELLARCEADDVRRKELMPDEQSAIRMFFDAWLRLKEMGWNDAIYCPKDGSAFEVIEAGSTGIHPCVYHGEWPNGTWWITADGDMSPSRPTLYRAASQSANVGETK